MGRHCRTHSTITNANKPPTNSNITTLHLSQQWVDSFAAAMERRQKPKALDLHQFLADSRPPMLTEDDMQRFARKSSERLTEQQTHAFADQLEQYLMHDRDNHEFIEEGHALRKLAQYMKWRTLASWLQLYANPTVRFRFSKCEFWRRKYDEHAHHCMPQPHHTPDITESIDRLARGLEARLDLRESSQPYVIIKTFAIKHPSNAINQTTAFKINRVPFKTTSIAIITLMETRTTGKIDPTTREMAIFDQTMALPTLLSATPQITHIIIALHTNNDNNNNLLHQCNENNDQMDTIIGNINNVRTIHDLQITTDDNKQPIFALTT